LIFFKTAGLRDLRKREAKRARRFETGMLVLGIPSNLPSGRFENSELGMRPEGMPDLHNSVTIVPRSSNRLEHSQISGATSHAHFVPTRFL